MSCRRPPPSRRSTASAWPFSQTLNGRSATALVFEARTGTVLSSFGTPDALERVTCVKALGTPEAAALEIVQQHDGRESTTMLIVDPRTGRPLELTPRTPVPGDALMVLEGRP